ncbi:hypothetical protein GALMADRAFT_254547 [Galerina marginata CBS 339.88]|uniref:Signal peptidase complex catalytic subunit SEC11 n=1 Tax=Galerina marginata (strain CBS 339.88) TaxID=685588 RepID=A0A067SW38_GALM3|nr:hypothetical protein GALMADRAFT_254547 [Galerina marginata CBS 339.88]
MWGHLPKRQVLLQSLTLASAIASMLMLYSGLGIVTNTESPIVVVLSGSMEPAFQRGDIIFLSNPTHRPYTNGDIVVYKIPGAEIPIVHRILETHDISDDHDRKGHRYSFSKIPGPIGRSENTPQQLLLTKGDNNPVDDVALYNGVDWLRGEQVIGKVWGFLPYVGYVSIAMNDMPRLKYAAFAAMGLAALIQRE